MSVAAAPNSAVFFDHHEVATVARSAHDDDASSVAGSAAGPFSFDGAARAHDGQPGFDAAASARAPDANGAGNAAPPSAAATENAGVFRRVRSTGRLLETGMRDGDRHGAVAMHLSPLACFWIGPFALAIPLVLWTIRREASSFADDHGRETVNFLISFTVLNVVLAFTVIGLLLLPVLWVVGVVSMIRGAMAAGRGEYFRYPVTMRFIT